jgi:amino acid permease
MKKFIKKMQERSEMEKRIFALWMALMFTLLIFCIWLLNFIAVFGNNNNSKVVIKNQANPITALFGEIKNTIFNATNKVYQNK